MKELIDARKAIVKDLQRARMEYNEAWADYTMSIFVDDFGVHHYDEEKKKKGCLLFDKIMGISTRLLKFDEANQGVAEEHRRQLEIKK